MKFEFPGKNFDLHGVNSCRLLKMLQNSHGCLCNLKLLHGLYSRTLVNKGRIGANTKSGYPGHHKPSIVTLLRLCSPSRHCIQTPKFCCVLTIHLYKQKSDAKKSSFSRPIERRTTVQPAECDIRSPIHLQTYAPIRASTDSRNLGWSKSDFTHHIINHYHYKGLSIRCTI
jgi:hypothetical protein